VIRQRGRQAPRGGVAIHLACGSLARAEPRDLEPRMIRQQCDELLSHLPGRAEYANFDRHDVLCVCVLCVCALCVCALCVCVLCLLCGLSERGDVGAALKTKKPTRFSPGRQLVARVPVTGWSALAHTDSDTAGPLSGEALSSVEGEAHECGSIAWVRMLQAFFHAWERRLAEATTDRVVRPFDWGLDWIAG